MTETQRLLGEQVVELAGIIRDLRRQLLWYKMSEWSEEMWAAGWGFGPDPEKQLRRYSEERDRVEAIIELAAQAGGWWVSPDEFRETTPRKQHQRESHENC